MDQLTNSNLDSTGDGATVNILHQTGSTEAEIGVKLGTPNGERFQIAILNFIFWQAKQEYKHS